MGDSASLEFQLRFNIPTDDVTRDAEPRFRRKRRAEALSRIPENREP